jgi:hypothetical protein
VGHHIRRAAAAFVNATRDGVQVASSLAERPTIAVVPTERAPLHSAINKMFAYGGQLPAGRHRGNVAGARRKMGDRRSPSSPGSVRNELPAIHRVLQFFREGATLRVQVGAGFGRRGAIVLSTATGETGGRYTSASDRGPEMKARQLGTGCRIIQNRLRAPQHLIPPKETEVSVRRTDLRARGMLKTDEDQRWSFCWRLSCSGAPVLRSRRPTSVGIYAGVVDQRIRCPASP